MFMALLAAWPARWLAGCVILVALSAGAARAGAPYRTDDSEPVDLHQFEMLLFSTGTRTAGGWTALLPAYEVNYGALPNLQLHAVFPLGYTSPAGGRTGFALADIELGAKFRFITPGEDDWFPGV